MVKLNGLVALFAPHVTVPLYVASAGVTVNVPPLDVMLTVWVPPPKTAGDELGEVDGLVLGEVDGLVLGEVDGLLVGGAPEGEEEPPPPHAATSIARAIRPNKNRIFIVTSLLHSKRALVM